ncbi:thiopurine S-methyltransferase (plasmid) [Variovorax sp. SRS16]|uniref:methyltransferase domain-containing protein n=1 Tax=Variovorax sp. SRS16 TaxID=282217 RepID=UPI001317B0DD|nr:methyltransferase domain-containing protein [Variovorax sp. SRS16]VTU46653.1 thiopurine S-methyltransferase [Variovorax sp. SRS16]
MAGPTPAFWQERFDKKETGWDRGGPSPRLLAWLEEGALQPCRIAVPGCGRGWEVAELAQRGFEVTAIDYTPAAVQQTRALLDARALEATVVQADVLSYQPEQVFDAVYEQTCLCALHPDHWFGYAQQLHRWLKPGAALWVMFMQAIRPAATETGLIEGPPYHCDINAMRALFTARDWEWPKPPYAKVPHSNALHELGLRLIRC